MKKLQILSLSMLVLGSLVLFSIGALSKTKAPVNKTIIDEWKSIKVPNPPVLQKVTIDPKTTAYLILDIVNNLCTQETRPRCVSSVPKIKNFLTIARTKGLLIGYSITKATTPKDILKEVFPLDGDPVIQSGVDKFYNTELEKILKNRGIKTIILVGTMAHGAILGTSTGGSLRGFNVIIPVDGMSSDNPYAEQYTTWHLKNSPGTKNNVTLTQFSLIQF